MRLSFLVAVFAALLMTGLTAPNEVVAKGQKVSICHNVSVVEGSGHRGPCQECVCADDCEGRCICFARPGARCVDVEGHVVNVGRPAGPAHLLNHAGDFVLPPGQGGGEPCGREVCFPCRGRCVTPSTIPD
jgi:hypothetical protein